MKRFIPNRVGLLATVGIGLLIVPFIGLLIRTPWARFAGDLSESGTAVRLSVVVSVTAALVALALGVPLGWALARGRFRGKGLVRAIVLLPIVLPPVVAGTALLASLGRRGFVGSIVDDVFGVTFPFTTPGAIIAASFVALPFVTLVAEAGFRAVDESYEEIAATLGAGSWRRFRRIALPKAAPALAAGAVLGWARALGEFGATVTFAGNLDGRTQTLPLAIFFELQSDPEAAFSLSLILVAVSVIVLVVARRAWVR